MAQERLVKVRQAVAQWHGPDGGVAVEVGLDYPAGGGRVEGGEAGDDNVDVEVDENKDENKEIAEISIQKAAAEGDTSPTCGDDKDGSDEDANPSNDAGKDVKFARLRGTHLSPVQDEDVEDLSSTIDRYVTDSIVIGK